MRILFLSNLYPPYNIGGYELICESVNRAMKSRGHETLVLTSGHSVAEKGLPAGESDVVRSLKIHGFFGHPWLGIRKLAALELFNNSELLRVVNGFQPDVIHVFNLGGLSKSLIHTIARLGIPVVYFVSDHWVSQSLKSDVWLDWWNRKSSSPTQAAVRGIWNRIGLRKKWDKIAPTQSAKDVKFRRIYFCSKFLRDRAVSCGWDVGHGEVIYNSVDTTRFSGSPSPKAKGCERLLFVGRLTKEKGIETVLKALLEVRGHFPGMLTVCGRGEPEYERALHRFVTQHSLPVQFIQTSAAQMPEIYKQHDALVFSSEWEEPFALTPLEAMSCGLPVISTTTGGSAELFHDGVNALTYEAGSAQELARQILKLHGYPELRERIATTGYDQVREHFSEAKIMDAIEQYVRKAVDEWPLEQNKQPSRIDFKTAKTPGGSELTYA